MSQAGPAALKLLQNKNIAKAFKRDTVPINTKRPQQTRDGRDLLQPV
jgi:hypothetical protein